MINKSRKVHFLMLQSWKIRTLERNILMLESNNYRVTGWLQLLIGKMAHG